MSEVFHLLLAAGIGALLGLIFFFGLWWTVRYRLASPYAALWFLGSLLVRSIVVVAGFYFVSGHEWRNIVACLVGFLAGKLLTVHIVRRKGDNRCA